MDILKGKNKEEGSNEVNNKKTEEGTRQKEIRE